MDFAYLTISTYDAARLRRFYAGLTGTAVTYDEPPYSVLGDGGAGARLAFQQIAVGQPIVAAHVDLHVEDIAAAGERVREAGGTLGADHSHAGTVWQQAFDPDGNVFCLMS
jgi:predicted enzyme related to lactoylglutathione lyase